MVYVTRKADRVPARARGFSWSGAVALGAGALALASGAAIWTEDLFSGARIPESAALQNPDTLSFDDRFLVRSTSGQPATDSLLRSLPSELEIKFKQAKDRLAQKLRPQGWRDALIDEAPVVPEEPKPFEEPRPSSAPAVPLPRSRPVEANLDSRNEPAMARAEIPLARAENRTLLDKLSDLLPGRVTLASLAPDGGLFAKKPDLASLGFDSLTAVYDISAHAVYMPDGSRLEAHSGYGSLMDDPAHVDQQNVGATPPNVYDLKPREALFHGVQALRMIPVGEYDTLGRSGLLAHSYMLGPNGDSNGCVSIKNYDRFLKAFTNGEIKRLIVVPRLEDRKFGEGRPEQRRTGNDKSAPRQSP